MKAKTLESKITCDSERHRERGFELPTLPNSPPAFPVFNPRTDPAFQAGMASLTALIGFIRDAPDSRTAVVARRVIRSAVSGVHFIRIHDMCRFDEKNMRHALNIIQAAARTPGEFRAWAYDHHHRDMHEVDIDSEEDFKELAQALLKY